MKRRLVAIAVAITAGLGATGTALAESTYGFDNAVAPATQGAVSARARVNVTINVPKLIVLRVGDEGSTQNAITFTIAPNVQSAPGTALVAGDNGTATWNAVAPTFSATGGGSLAAYLWHNNSGNATLSCSASALTGAGLTAADILVSNGGSGLSHPGTGADCGTPITTLARNTLHNASWTYSLNSSSLANALPGSWTTTITYTATTP